MTERCTCAKLNEEKVSASAAFFSIMIVAVSTVIMCIVYTNIDRVADYYRDLALMPFIFIICTVLTSPLLHYFKSNFSVTLTVGMLFIKMCISPLLIILGGTNETITLGVEQNTPKAILLICYDCIAIFMTLFLLCVFKPTSKSISIQDIRSDRESKFTKSDRSMLWFLILCGLLLFALYFIENHIFDMYRTIFHITDKHFTSMEDSYIVSKYSTTFLKKFALVTSVYVMSVLRLLVPGVGVYWSGKLKNRKLGIVLSLLWSLSPMLLVSGAIARSLYYSLILLFVSMEQYNPTKFKSKFLSLSILGLFLILIYWWIRYRTNNSNPSIQGFMHSLSWSFSAYFSGVNVIAGAWNLPDDFKIKLHYFLYDYLKGIPYGNTLFNLHGSSIETFFNTMNESTGQIPPTCAIGYYYFGPIFAPLYSIVFVTIGFKAADKCNRIQNPLMKCVLYLATLYGAMGIGMYGIAITVGNLIVPVLPLYIIIRCFYGKEIHNQNQLSLPIRQ